MCGTPNLYSSRMICNGSSANCLVMAIELSVRPCATALSSMTTSRICRSAGRLDRPAGRRPLPRRTARRCGAVRLRGRPAFLEALPASADRAPVAGTPKRATAFNIEDDGGGRAASPSLACAPANCTRSPSRIRSIAWTVSSTRSIRRGGEDAFIVAVNCGQAGGTCFCVSMDTGPKVEAGFDLALTELLDGDQPSFPGRGRQRARAPPCLPNLPHRPAPRQEIAPRPRPSRERTAHMGRQARYRWAARNCCKPTRPSPLGRCRRPLPDLRQLHDGLSDLLLHHRRGPHRSHRRLPRSACAAGIPVSRWTSPTSMAAACAARRRSRYRQWMTHKLANWIDQFGTSGCVGCGRCITWCPVGIDITEEAAAIRATAGSHREE